MSEICKLAPQKVWEIFDLICSIPHISGHEAQLASELIKLAQNAGLETIRDTVGNVIIHRPAAAGFENAPKVIIQAHMDMVPASDGEFDFINCAISPYIEDGWVTARGTTLGADDGIGVAHAMAVILDKEFACGALTVILTVDEESGMSGAANLAPEHLAGSCLLNLDGSDNFCIGCAGGARQEITFIPGFVPPPAGNAFKVTVAGLPGGHSGGRIHDNRGNALKFIAEFLDQIPDIKLHSITGGTADNAIPYFAAAVGVSSRSIDELQQMANACALLIKADCPHAADMTITVEKTAMPDKIWQDKFARDLLSSLLLVPNEVMDFDDELDIVKTSSNLAMIHSADDKVTIRTSQRSLSDPDRENISAAIAEHFKLFGGSSKISNIYPATPPAKDSHLLSCAIKCAHAVGKKECKPYAIHAGLESGWFFLKNPELEIITCGPDHQDIHTPAEKLNIASVGEFDKFLRALLLELAK